MMKSRTLSAEVCLALAAALAVGGCASNSNPFSKTDDFQRTFIGAAQTWDLNKDGSVSCDEWAQYASSAFRDGDRNGDGALDAEEWTAVVRGDRLFEVANLAYYDANGDGRVSLEEITGKQNIAFQLLDRNKDCQIDRTETVQVHGVDVVKPKEGTGAPDQSQQIPRR